MKTINYSKIKTKNNIEWNLEAVKDCMLLSPLSAHICNKNIPITSDCNFSDAIWDLNKFNSIGRSRKLYIYNFSNIQYPYDSFAKKIILSELFLKQRKSPNTVQQRLSDLRTFFRWISERKVRYLEQINLTLIKEYCEGLTICEAVICSKKLNIRIFLEELQKCYPNTDFSSEYEYLNSVDKSKVKHERENRKLALIPFISTPNKESVFDRIVSLALIDINNPTTGLLDKMSACMIIILAETGMRIGEFHKLEVNKLIDVSIPKCNEKQYYLEFLTYKTSPSKGHLTITFLTPSATLAYNTLVNILSSYRVKSKTKYLYINTQTGDKYKQECSLEEHIVRFFIRHQSDFDFDNFTSDDLKPFSKVELKKNCSRYGCNSNLIGQSFYYISPHHFRVTVATILYTRENRSLEWIKRHMNHMAEDMTIHYIREEAFKKKINLVETIIRRASKDGDFLETDQSKVLDPNIKKELEDEFIKSAYVEINEFLGSFTSKAQDKRIFNNVDQIINSILKKHIPLKEMATGFCAADALLVLCERQEYINIIESSYDLGITIPALETLPFDLQRYRDKVRVIEYDKTLIKEEDYYFNLFVKEVKKLKLFIENRLLPELQLLNSEYSNPDIKHLPNYNDLFPTESSLQVIIEEVSSWLSD